MDDMDKNEIDLDEDDNNSVEDIARLVNIFFFVFLKHVFLVLSNVFIVMMNQ
jgi:hypothetical protein